MKKIISVSRILKWSAIVICAALPLLEAGYWITNGYPFFGACFQVGALPAFGDWPVGWSDLTGEQKLLAFLSNLITIVFSMASLAYLAKTFASLERLQLFEKENALNVRKAGWAMFGAVLVHPISTACLSLSLTYRNPVGHRNLSIQFGSPQLIWLGLGMTLLLLSWILQEAAEMHEEQLGTV
jgi:hypothetical protein